MKRLVAVLIAALALTATDAAAGNVRRTGHPAPRAHDRYANLETNYLVAPGTNAAPGGTQRSEAPLELLDAPQTGSGANAAPALRRGQGAARRPRR